MEKVLEEQLELLKIDYNDKEDLMIQPDIEEVNKVTAADMNSIKRIVNQNADTSQRALNDISALVNIHDNSITEIDENINTLSQNLDSTGMNLQSATESIQQLFNNVSDTNKTVSDNSKSIKEIDAKLKNINDLIPEQTPDVPVGTIINWGSETIPEGFMQLNGQILSKSDYPDLYNFIGGTYVETTSTFSLPNQYAGAEGIDHSLLPKYYFIIKTN